MTDSQANVETTDLDSLLDLTLDDLDKLPSDGAFKPGAHKVIMTMESKVVSDKPAIQCDMVYVECLEMANPEDEAPKEGDTATNLFFLNNKWGLAAAKKVIVPLANSLGCSNMGETVAACQGIEVTIATTVDKQGKYMDITELFVD